MKTKKTNSRQRYSVFVLLIFLTVVPFVASTGQTTPTDRPFIRLPMTGPSSPQSIRFLGFVDQALAGKNPYGFGAADAVIAYRITQDSKYLDLAIKTVEQAVQEEESLIAAGEKAQIAFNSYLYVGPKLFDLAVTYDSAFNKLTEQQRARWTDYAEQAVWNIWHPKEARWGTNLFPWSGWSISNPGNNYYYSFILATMSWALASQNQEWLTFLRTQKLPPLVDYYANIPGGGSREGTGYGSSHRRLFQLYQIWRDSTGEDLAGRSPHARQSIDYWVHATVPTLDVYAPLGDQSRSANTEIYDYQRSLVINAISLSPNSEEARRGRWWLRNIALSQMRSPFNFGSELVPWEGVMSQPADLLYHASGVGHLFARTSWRDTATWLSIAAGVYEESHDHQHQGSFNLYRLGWLAVTENFYSHSGIHQEPEVHNLVRFVDQSGNTIKQTYGSQSSLNFTDTKGLLTVNADLTPAYAKNAALVQAWKRRFTFSGPKLLIDDDFRTGPGVKAVWQLNTPSQPIIQGDVIRAGELTIKPLNPPLSQLQSQIVDWKALDADKYPRGGYKVELSGSTQQFQMELTIEGGEPRVGVTRLPAPTSLRVSGQ